jgi:hypothetical protein
MDTLHDGLADLADNAPTGGAPADELWTRGKRAHRFRVAGAAAALLVVAAVATGIGVRLADSGDDRSGPAPAAGIDGIILPIEYPAGQQLPDLGDAPGPLAAVWVTPSEGGGAPEVVGLVAETGVFGTLPIDPVVDVENTSDDPGVALSPDGRRVAHNSRNGEEVEAVVHDLVTGRKAFPTIENASLSVYDWIDATHLYGSPGDPDGDGWVNDGDGWVWEPGKAAKLVSLLDSSDQPYLGSGWPYAGTKLIIRFQGPGTCAKSPPLVSEAASTQEFEVPMFCDVLGVIGSEILLGDWNPEGVAGGSSDPEYAKGTVVALDIRGTDLPYLNPEAPRGPDADHALEDPARRHAVVTAGAPHRVAFATDLIGRALESSGGAS